MNCPSRTEEIVPDGYNQNPNPLSADLTTKEDLNGRANNRERGRIDDGATHAATKQTPDTIVKRKTGPAWSLTRDNSQSHVPSVSEIAASTPTGVVGISVGDDGGIRGQDRGRGGFTVAFVKLRRTAVTFGKFVGPGFMISVAYIDPGNYSTDVAAGATYRFKLLFIILMSNVIAIFLQSLCIKLGSISGLNLAEACKEFLPKWMNLFLYVMAEAAIIATDIAEVIGTAIAINLLIPQIPLVAGCALSIVDVLLILLFYQPNGSMRGLRTFEMFVAALVLGVVICFCIQLSMIQDTSIGAVFRGYLPSSAIVQSQGLYQACGILGATVMPHSLYLGSGIVQSRLQEFDIAHGIHTSSTSSALLEKVQYYPSLPAINFCMKYSIAELAIALFTFALFVNSAILIVAGAQISGNEAAPNADLFGIYHLLSTSVGKAAGTIFALALLLSGISAGVVCTIAGQMVSEGALNWSLPPWQRRLITRSISITPSIIIAGAVGREGLSAALNGSQVALSVVLPFVSAPLIYFTCRNKYMTVKSNAQRQMEYDCEERVNPADSSPRDEGYEEGVKMRNHWVTAVIAVLIWLIVTIMNLANLVLLGKGKGGSS